VPDNSPDAGSPIPIDSSGGHPIVLLVAERGSSMLNEKDVDGTIVTGQWNDYPSRWDRVRELVAALEPYAGEIAFGALSYTGEGMVQCPVIAGTVEPATDDYDNLRAAFPPTDEVRPEVKGESPADAALQVAVDSLTALPNDRAKYILLFTRGTPDTCALPDPQCGGDNALHVIQTAFTSGIRTLVVGFNAADEPVANDLAQAGRGLPVRPPTEDEQTCLYTERSAEGLQFDFTDWRSYTAATYAADGYTYADDLTIPPDDTEAFLNVVEQIATGTF
jgi:hypothetical protein